MQSCSNSNNNSDNIKIKILSNLELIENSAVENKNGSYELIDQDQFNYIMQLFNEVRDLPGGYISAKILNNENLPALPEQAAQMLAGLKLPYKLADLFKQEEIKAELLEMEKTSKQLKEISITHDKTEVNIDCQQGETSNAYTFEQTNAEANMMKILGDN